MAGLGADACEWGEALRTGRGRGQGVGRVAGAPWLCTTRLGLILGCFDSVLPVRAPRPPAPLLPLEGII